MALFDGNCLHNISGDISCYRTWQFLSLVFFSLSLFSTSLLLFSHHITQTLCNSLFQFWLFGWFVVSFLSVVCLKCLSPLLHGIIIMSITVHCKRKQKVKAHLSPSCPVIIISHHKSSVWLYHYPRWYWFTFLGREDYTSATNLSAQAVLIIFPSFHW